MTQATALGMLLPPGEPSTMISLRSSNTKVGLMLDSGRLPGRGRVGSFPDEAERIGSFEIEVVHLVVEQHARARHDQARSEGHVDGLRQRDRHAVLVDHREVGGVRAFVQRRIVGEGESASALRDPCCLRLGVRVGDQGDRPAPSRSRDRRAASPDRRTRGERPRSTSGARSRVAGARASARTSARARRRGSRPRRAVPC